MNAYIQHLQNELEQTPQDPIWHGEGNVWNHTKLVCDAMTTLPEYLEADETTRKALYLAAVYHDIGKARTTCQKDDRWAAPSHARVSAQMARQMLWLEQGLCGTKEMQQLRETVCGLVRYHSLPLHAIDEPDGKLRLLRFAANGSLASRLTVKNLCTLAKADILGRICPDQQELLEKVALCQELAREAGCYESPYPFPDTHTRFAVLSGKDVPVDYPLYDDTWGEVILMSGLPGTGKDTWIRENCADLPMISLDDIRRDMKILPTDNQSKVLEFARACAKEYLRKKQPFVWNATNLSPMVRGRQTSLFADYGASVRIVYLETDWAEQLRRNRNRPDAVPERAVCKMLDTLMPPEIHESQRVDWLIM